MFGNKSEIKQIAVLDDDENCNFTTDTGTKVSKSINSLVNACKKLE